ncbi:MAG: RDD family protein [Lacibacter sp.]
MESNQQHSGTDLLTDMQYQIVQASTGKRFANFLIDRVLFLLVFVGGTYALALSNPEAFSWIDDSSIGFNIIDRLITLILYGLFMFACEALFRGKSLGKLITGTRAVNQDGTPITIQTALMRGLSRMVPFEAFSALGTPSFPWHDKWTDTYVIDEKNSNYQLRITE